MVKQFTIVPRKKWLANAGEYIAVEVLEGKVRRRPLLSPDVQGQWVGHYLAGPSTEGHSGAAVMLRTLRYHVISKRWSDIAYHFGIDQDGVIYEGCPLPRKGASVRKHNHEIRAFVFLIGVGQTVSAEAEAAAAWLVRTEMPKQGIAYRAISPHSLWTATQCPSDSGREAINRIADQELTALETPEMDDEMKFTIEGIALYIDRAYEVIGERKEGQDMAGRWYWLNKAIEADDPMTVLGTMVGLLAQR